MRYRIFAIQCSFNVFPLLDILVVLWKPRGSLVLSHFISRNICKLFIVIVCTEVVVMYSPIILQWHISFGPIQNRNLILRFCALRWGTPEAYHMLYLSCVYTANISSNKFYFKRSRTLRDIGVREVKSVL